MNDRYGNDLGTADEAVVALYNRALDAILAGEGDMRARFDALVDAAPDMALAHTGRARTQQIYGDMAGAKASVAQARSLAADGTRAALHADVMEHVLSGRGAQAYKVIRDHLTDHPRDAIVAQMCTSIFGLIGFSGQPGREAELLAFTDSLFPHYGDDWWMLSQHAFSLCEVGETDRADAMIDRALEQRPDNGHSAHVRSHVWYEAGETAAGITYLRDWLDTNAKDGLVRSHLAWHAALWSLGEGDIDAMWTVFDAEVSPDSKCGLPINVVTDTASLLYRAEMAGVAVDPRHWRAISEYCARVFPATGIGFIDTHAALAHAMAGNGDEVARIIKDAKGPSADVTRPMAAAYGAIARQNWAEAQELLIPAMAIDVRLGGSRAQRDLMEFTYATILLRLGRGDEAARTLTMRRPVQARAAPIAGLDTARLH